MNKKILMIIPCFNEQDAIKEVYDTINDYSVQSGLKLDVVVINDCSTDNTLSVLEENHIPHISLIHNLGIGGAVQTGYIYALMKDYDIAVQFDGDGQHDIRSIQHLISPLLDDTADFCIGSRFIDGQKSSFQTSGSRRMGIKLISTTIRLVTGEKILDTTSGYRAGNRKVIEEFSRRYAIEYPEPITTTELIKKKFRIKEIAVEMFERQTGKSSIHAWKNVYYMINVLLSIVAVACQGGKKK